MCQVYIDTVTQQSRGFGFVSYSTVAEADRAIVAMNGFTVNGKQLKVQKKKEKSSSWEYSNVDNTIQLTTPTIHRGILERI